MSDVNLATEQLLELLLTLKKTTPAAARGILNSQPAIAYALITLMVSMNAINIEVFQRTLAEFGAANASIPTPTPQTMDSIMASAAPLSAIPPHLQAQYLTTTPPSIPQTPPYASYPHPHTNGQDSSSHAYTSTPPNMNNNHMGYGQQQQPIYADQYQQQQQQPAYPGYPPTYTGGQAALHQPAMTAAPSNLTDALASIPDEQKALIMRVLAMTPEQINTLPPTERSTYIQIRATLGIPTG